MNKEILKEEFLNSINFFKSKIQIYKSTMNINNTCSFDGYINILFDEAGIIYDWKLELSNISVDLLTTKSWYGKPKWSKRVEIFNIIDPFLQIEIRENRQDHKIVKLNKLQVQNLNNFWNNQNNTIKNIITFLKGSNPTGEIQNPQASELQALMGENKINFALFFKENSYFEKNNQHNFEQYWVDSIEKDYFSLLKTINLQEPFKCDGIMKKNLYDLLLMTSDKNFKMYYKKWENNLKINLKENIKLIKEIDEGIRKARSQYYKDITEHYDLYKVWDIPKEEIQRAHIISAKYVRYELIETIYTNFYMFEIIKQKYLNEISDPYNFLNLPNAIHQQFDKIKFNYDYISGEVDEEGAKILEKNKTLQNIEMYKFIPLNKLNSKRVNYLKKRDQILNSNQKFTL